MGMESYFVDILPKGITMRIEDAIRKYEGTTEISAAELLIILKKAQLPIRQKNEGIYIIDEAIQLHLTLKNQYVQAIELQGCFTWFEEGLVLCYKIAESINNDIFYINTSILSQEVDLGDFESFKSTALELYNEKYNYFKTDLANFKAKVLPSEFYSYRKRYLKKNNSIITKILRFIRSRYRVK